ncbi:MAG: hypothetical protein ACHQ1H_02740 [Nitrososphaerales archaeon]
MSRLGGPEQHSGMDDTFPYGVFHIRWEFTNALDVILAFDKSNLVALVQGFT